MTVDYYLVARAEKLPSTCGHHVANLLSLYVEGIRVGRFDLAQDAEHKLRACVVKAALAQKCCGRSCRNCR